MKISQLEYVLAVERTGSINLAAEQLFVSQSRVSSAIIQLENELGQPLFIRSNKGIALTAFGKEFLPYARSVIAQINQMKSLGQDKISPTKSLTICNNNFDFASRLAAKLYTLHKNENISINLQDGSRQQCIDTVSNHLAELAVGRIWNFQSSILSKQLSSKNVSFFPIAVLPIAAVVGKNNPLFYHPENSITLSMLQKFSPVIFEFSQYNPMVNIYDQLPELHIKNHITVASRSACTAMLEETDAYTITAEYADPGKPTIDVSPNCRVLKIRDCSYYGQIGWFKHKHTELSPLAQEFVDLLTEYLQIG